ncbi:MAG: hypothetical protein HYV13_00505 [Candidatus Doudnabacteria bacterium]|nr:hypothetical protein [Candidatus Doudnabacteria bacterium]
MLEPVTPESRLEDGLILLRRLRKNNSFSVHELMIFKLFVADLEANFKRVCTSDRPIKLSVDKLVSRVWNDEVIPEQACEGIRSLIAHAKAFVEQHSIAPRKKRARKR